MQYVMRNRALERNVPNIQPPLLLLFLEHSDADGGEYSVLESQMKQSMLQHLDRVCDATTSLSLS